MSNFIENCLSGKALLEDLEEYMDAWEEGDSQEEVYEFLGMTKEEYMLWVKDSDNLSLIIKARREGRDTIEFVNEEVLGMAARAQNVKQGNELKAWLKLEGLWKS